MTTREPISIENGRVEIHTPENRVWLTRHQIADLFGVFVPAVGSNIRSILKSGILREERVYRRERNRDGGIVELYSLEMIAALAFRLNPGMPKPSDGGLSEGPRRPPSSGSSPA